MRPWVDAITAEPVISRCVAMALASVTREFPCQLPFVWQEPFVITRPRDVTPVFYGCYDWHSAVHSHWLLLRAWRLCPDAAWRDDVWNVLATQFAREKLDAEYAFLAATHRVGFERPYGLAWLLQLTAELRLIDEAQAREWLDALAPLEMLAIDRLLDWMTHLPGPVRSGEHSSSAFAMALMVDWTDVTRSNEVRTRVVERALALHGRDANLPSAWEPGAFDFLSPSLTVADLMARCLPNHAFSDWLANAFPSGVPALSPWLPREEADGKLAHGAGLNFSRAWMAARIARPLPDDRSDRVVWQELAKRHWTTALPSLDSTQYSITHWVGSFALRALCEFTPDPAFRLT